MSGKLTKDQLDVIRKRSEKAKAGPWKLCGNKWGDLVVYSGMNNGGEIAEMEFTTTQLEDADFIANARQDIPALLDHIAEVEQELREATLIIDRVENLLSKMRHGAEYEVYGEVYRFLYGKDDEDDNV